MPQSTDQVQSDWITGRIRNQLGAGEGTTFPPKLQNGIRIPLVQNFKVLQTLAFNGGTQATLSWTLPDGNATLPISSFLLSLKGIQSGTANVSMAPVTVSTSPAVIRINSSIETVAIVSIQTILTNGQSSLLSDSPTCAVNTIAPILTPSDIPPSTLEGLNVVLGYSNLTTTNGVAYVSGTGTITEDPTNFSYDPSTKRLGLLTSSPKSTIHDTGSLGVKVSSQVASFTAANAVIYLCDATAGNILMTLPTASTVIDRIYYAKKTDSSINTVTVNGFVLAFPNETLQIVSNGTSWINLIHSIY